MDYLQEKNVLIYKSSLLTAQRPYAKVKGMQGDGLKKIDGKI